MALLDTLGIDTREMLARFVELRVGRRMLPLFLIAAIPLACESDVDRARREAAAEEARLYGDEAARAGDRAERLAEKSNVTKLEQLVENQRATRSNVALGESNLIQFADKGPGYEAARAYERGKLEEYRSRLPEFEKAIATQRALVEADRVKLLELEKATRAALAARATDGGVGQGVLRDRLAGIEKSLADVNRVLAGERDGG
jgi:hypothetical protein